jgi:hypothetical protein
MEGEGKLLKRRERSLPTLDEYLEQVENYVKNKKELQDELLVVQRQVEHVKHGGSLLGKSANKHRDWNDGYQRILNDYFCIDPIYDINDF